MKASSAIAAQRFLSSGTLDLDLGALDERTSTGIAEESLRLGRFAATGPPHERDPARERLGGTARGLARPRAPPLC